MNKRKYQSLVKRAVRAARLDLPEYDSIMDEAGQLLDWPKDNNDPDELWIQFCKDVDAGSKVPLTDKEKKMVENRQKREALESAKAQLKYAQQLYDSLTIKRAR